MIINKLLVVRIVVLFYYFAYTQGCTIYYVQNDTSKLQTVRIIYNQNNDQTKKNELRLIAAEKAGKIVELHKYAEGLEKIFFDFRLPPKKKLPLNRLLSSTYFDTSSYASICYPAKNTYGIDTMFCLRFDQLASNTTSDGFPFLLVRSKKKIFIK